MLGASAAFISPFGYQCKPAVDTAAADGAVVEFQWDSKGLLVTHNLRSNMYTHTLSLSGHQLCSADLRSGMHAACRDCSTAAAATAPCTEW